MVVDAISAGEVPGGRAELPRPLADEIGRSRLVEGVARRWDVKLTVIEAAGGFGKSVAIAQAIRDNDADPSGIDVYARFRSTHESHESVAVTLLDHLADRQAPGPDLVGRGRERLERRVDLRSTGGAVSAIANAVADHSPFDVCVCLDDVHEAGAVDGATEFIRLLLDALPANGHLLLSGRSVDMVKRARLRAADDLLEIGEDLLAFDDAEVAALAGRHDVSVEELARAGGWPAVTRLAVNPGFDASREFLLEELVDHLPLDVRRAVFVAATSGVATPALLDACGIEISPADMLTTVPLLVDYSDGVGAHDLWQDVVEHLVSEDEASRFAARIVEALAADDRLPEAINIAAKHGLIDDALAHIMKVFEHGDDRVTAAMVDRWIGSLGAELDGRPEADFLAGFQLRLAGDVAEGAVLLASAAVGFEERGDMEAETTVVKELGMCSWLLSDSSIWKEAADRSTRLVAAGSERMRRSTASGRIAGLDLKGDFKAVMAMYRDFDRFDEIALRHAATVAVLVGDVAQAVDWADRLVAEFPKPLVIGQRDATYWQIGRPQIERLLRQPTAHDLGNARNQFLSVVFTSMMGACVGRIPDVRVLESLAWSRNRERTFVALVHAAHDLLTGSEQEAQRAFVNRLDEIGHADPLLRGELRRFLPYAYVLSPVDREWMDAAELSPLHRDLRAAARALVDARAAPGSPIGELPDHDATLAWLPLPWSIELATLLAEANDARGVALAAALSGWVGAPAHRELRRLRDRSPHLTRAADSILSVVPGPPEETTSISVCGPTRVEHGGSVREISRRRVREALQLLTLRPSWTRTALAAALWPDLDEARAAANLRSTLRHLRLDLEPSREAGEAAFHLRQNDNRLSLHRSEWFQVDLWTIDDLLAEGQRAESAARLDDAVTARLDAVAIWHAEAFAEARHIEEVTAAVAEVERRVIAAGCWAAERQLSFGDHNGALASARRVLELDPLSERAHDVRVGVHLATGDLDAASASVYDLVETSRSLGVAPSSGSEMLIRRYERRTGRVAHRSRDSTAG